MNRYQLFVLSNPIEGLEEAFNEWYTNVHLRDVLKIDGFVSAQRFRIIGDPINAEHVWRYGAVYNMRTDSPRAVIEEMMRRGGTDVMPLTSALDPNLYVVLYEAITPIVECDSEIPGPKPVVDDNTG